MKRGYTIAAMFFLFSLQAGCGTEGTSDTAFDTTGSVADVVSTSAGGVGQAGTNSAPDASTSLSLAPPKSQISLSKAISGFTFDSPAGTYEGSTANGATPTLKFYLKSDGSKITVDPTDAANYVAGKSLFGVTPFGKANSGVQMEITVDVNKTFSGGYTVKMTAVSSKVDGEPDKIGPDAEYSYTASSGTITGTFGTINMSNISFTAAKKGAKVTGSYDYSVTTGGTTYTGTANFNEKGCSGASVKDSNGNTLGTAELNNDGLLVFTEMGTGNKMFITRVE